jgi:hypothetical protein
VKLVRTKDTLAAYRSADGISWTSITSQTYNALAANVYIGLAVCSHNTAAIARGVFDTVSVATAVPVITSAKTALAIADSSFNFQVIATNAAYHYTATGLPNGLSINTGTGVISGAPATAGTFPVVVTATNALGTATDTLVITVDTPMTATIADVYAMNPAVDDKNTIYIGYGPASLTVTAAPQGGTLPYRYLWNTGDTTAWISVSAAGTYRVTVADSIGFTTTASIVMNSLDVRCGNNNDKVTICHNGNTICVSQSAVPAHLNHGDHLGCCTGEAARKATAGTAIDGNASPIIVYPNPVSDMLTIQLGKLNTGAVMQLYNAGGVLVETERLVNSTTALSIKTLPAGMYYVTIKNGEMTVTRKIVKL